MAKPTRDVWANIQLATIEHRLESRYGDGWRNCFSKSVQDALFDAELLNLIMTQAMDKFAPAQELVRRVRAVPKVEG